MRNSIRLLISGAAALFMVGSLSVGSMAQAAVSARQAMAQGMTGPAVTVQLLAWPKSADNDVKLGGKVPTVVLDTVTASPSGTYVLRASAPELVAVANAQGYVNLEALAGGRPWFFVRHISSSGSLTATSEESATVVRVPFLAAKSNVSPLFCNTHYIRQMRASPAVIGQEYITAAAGAGNKVSSGFQYFSDQSSSLGIGISVNADGGYHAGGTNSESSSGGEIFPTVSGPSHIWNRTYFRVAKYLEICVFPGGQSDTYIVRSNGWAGGANEQHPSAVPVAHNCLIQAAGSTFYTERSTAVTWSGGFTTPIFNASSQTGYDQGAKIIYHFHARRYACGTRNQAPAFAKQVVAEN